jgi:iron complex transport system permease protein
VTATVATSPRIATAPTSRRGRVLVVGLVAALVLVVLASAALGAYAVAPADVLRVIGARLGLPVGEVPTTVDAVLWQVRLPRVGLALLVGACLGLAGAVMQGVFANPLAEPGTVGVSAGAAVGAVVAIVTGAAALSVAVVPAAAFVGGVATTLVVHRLARSGGRTEVVTLLLTGIGVNALAGAVIGWCTFVSDDAQLRSITFWSLGSVGLATWPVVLAVLPFAVVGLILAPRLARSLDLLALGDRPAAHLGLDVERVRRRSIVLVALLTAAAVAAAGIVGFVGLVVPHLVRLVAGPLHGTLLVASALGGALLVLLADLVGRTAAAPAEIPLGVVTALVGAPVFLWLVRRARQESGGWG